MAKERGIFHTPENLALNKLPQITLAFWIMKIYTTTLGETAGDLLSMTLNVGYTASSLILFSAFVVVLLLQLSSKKYHPLLYWSVILATSTAGTTMSDFMDRTLGLGYMKGSLILLSVLLAIFAYWYFSGKSMSVANIRTFKVEVLYWVAILFSNTLGTALGDFLADNSGLGFMGGAVLIGALIAAVAAAAYFTTVSRVLLFWIAFVLTRPFGGTFGDVLTKPVANGGVGFGTIGSSAVLLTILIIGVLITLVKLQQQAALARPRIGSRNNTRRLSRQSAAEFTGPLGQRSARLAAFGEHLGRGPPAGTSGSRMISHCKPAEGLVDGLGAAAAPTVGAEGHRRFAQRPQTFEITERGGGHRHHAAVERRGAEGHGGRIEHLGRRSA